MQGPGYTSLALSLSPLNQTGCCSIFFSGKELSNSFFPSYQPGPHHFVSLSFSFFIFYFGGKCCAKIKPQQFYLMLCIQSAPMGILSGSPWEMLCAFCMVKDNWFTSILSTDWLTCSLGRKEEIGGAWLKLSPKRSCCVNWQNWSHCSFRRGNLFMEDILEHAAVPSLSFLV